MERRKQVVVVFPVYQEHLQPREWVALQNNVSVLSRYPAVFLKPEGLPTDELSRAYPDIPQVEVSGRWLGLSRGIQGYNEMMLSASFYELFADYEYMLVAHLDAWVFRDELAAWCNRGYDLVAAPWPKRRRYRCFPLKQYLWVRMRLKPRNTILHCQLYGRIGNGGLSLRRVSTFREACLRYGAAFQAYRSHHPLTAEYNEDVLWAVVPQTLKVPPVETALRFAIDVKPQWCYRQAGHRLPMGCHGYHHASVAPFWRQHIPATGF